MTTTRFVTGPPIRPKAALLAWLEELGKGSDDRRPCIRLPVVVRYASHDAFPIREAFVGTAHPPPDEDVLRLKLDDTALGIALDDRLHNRITPDTTWFALWLEGYWGPLVAMPDFPTDGPPLPTFAVLKVLEDVKKQDGPNPALCVLVESG